MSTQPAAVQLLHERSEGYQLFLVSFGQQCSFVIADSIVDAYQMFRASRDNVPDKIQVVDLAGMGYFLLKKRESWSDG